MPISLPENFPGLAAAGKRLRESKFAKDASSLFILNVISRGIAFFGTSYAARCLGPAYFGISTLVQTTAGQAALFFDGGFQMVVMRKIAGDKDKANDVSSLMITFRLAVALALCVIWAPAAFIFAPPAQRLVWTLGVPSLILLATNLTIIFQGLERLPEQTLINTVGVALMAVVYFVFFRPGMFLGADLLVISVAGILTTAATWGSYYRLFKRLPVRMIDFQKLLALLRESKLYWLRSIVGTVYPAVQIFLIVSLMTARDLGIYRSALAMATAVEFLASSISSLLLARLVVWKQSGVLFMWRRQTKLLLVLSAAAIPVTVLIIALTPDVYSLMLGPEYSSGAAILQIIIVGKLAVFLGQSYMWGLVAVQRDKTITALTFLIAGLSLVINGIMVPLYGLKGAALSLLFTDVLFPVLCYRSLRAFVLSPKEP